MVAGVTLLHAVLSAWMHYHVRLNDFWAVYFIATRMDFADPNTVQNGFFPIGYPFLLLISPLSEIHTAFILNTLATGCIAAATAYIAWNAVGPRWAAATSLLALLVPATASYAFVTSPDAPMTALLTLAGAVVVYALREHPSPKVYAFFLAGVLAGFAALFRSHALLIGFMLIAIGGMVSGRRVPSLASGLVGIALACSPQVIVNLWAGKGPFSTGQAFNIYRMAYGTNWNRIDVTPIPSSVVEVIAIDPPRFLASWVEQIYILAPFLMPGLICAAIMPWERFGRMNMVFLLSSAVYVPLVALGGSPRAFLPLLPVVVIQIVCICNYVLVRIAEREQKQFQSQTFTYVLSIAAALLVAGYFTTELSRVLHERRDRHDAFIQVEARAHDLGVDASTQVFSTERDLYLPNTPDYFTWRIGGWRRVGIYGYRAEFPSFPYETKNEFLSACAERSIKLLVLDHESAGIADWMDSLYREDTPPGSREAQMIAEYRLIPLAP